MRYSPPNSTYSLSAMVTSETKIDGNSLCVSQMKETVRLGWESSDDRLDGTLFENI